MTSDIIKTTDILLPVYKLIDEIQYLDTTDKIEAINKIKVRLDSFIENG